MESVDWGAEDSGTSGMTRSGGKRMLGRYPVVMLVVGFLAGVAVGWLVKRR